MKREILCRIWDADIKHMDYDPKWGHVSDMRISDWFGMKDIFPMFSTTLFDKEGSEIYEGDIIECPCWESKGALPAAILQHEINKKHSVTRDVVIFRDGMYGVMSSHGKDIGQFVPLCQFNDISTTIGNIYQHPHLLTHNT